MIPYQFKKKIHRKLLSFLMELSISSNGIQYHLLWIAAKILMETLMIVKWISYMNHQWI